MASSLVEICDLPDEVLCYIFSNLKPEFVIQNLMNVCYRWNSIVAENKIFWNDIQLAIDCDYFIGHEYLREGPIRNSYYHSESTEVFIGEVDLEKVYKLQSLKFTNGSKVMGDSVELLIEILSILRKCCKNIEKVVFESCFGATSIQFMRMLRESYKNMKEMRININNCKSDYYADLEYRIPYDEISRFANLNTLVACDRMFKSSDLYTLAEGCENLNSLWILASKPFEIRDILYFLEKKKKSLKELGIGISLKDCILNKLKECHQLEVLYATDASIITDDCMKSFADQSPLKYCSLHKATFQRSTVFEIAGRCRKPGVFEHLKVLDLTGYEHYCKEAFRSWNSSDTNTSSSTELPENSCSSRLMSQIKITFSNRPTFSNLMSQQHPDSQYHRMYCPRFKESCW